MATSHQQPQGNDVGISSQISASLIVKNRKEFNDPIHGQIEIHPVCIRVIDTPQFQRLRHIKQLDTCYLVYPGASHNRFEHSLGVCHLAGKLLRTIRERQPDVNITDTDILCVEIAGLCHDLGQGPFSHVFEKKLMPRLKKKFTHEGAARKMFEYMLDNNNGEVKKDIQKILADCKLQKFEEEDFTFIKEMIDDPKNMETENWPYEGRSESKSFMYEIVANKRNGIDVDKWDYIARDSYMLGMKVNFDHNRCFASARVLEVNVTNGGNGKNGQNGQEGTGDRNESSRTDTPHESGENDERTNEGNRNVYRKQICYREKVAQDLYDMFYTRMTLHRRAYQHKTHNLIGMMICDALTAASDTLLIYKKSISEIVEKNDMAAFTHLTDDVIQLILDLPNGDEGPGNVSTHEESSDHIDPRSILRDISNRRLYKCVGQTQIEKGKLKDEEEFKKQFTDILTEDERPVEERYIGYDIVNLDYGMEEKDPMENVRFYRKDDINTPIKLTRTQVSYVLPDTFAEHVVRVYCKDTGPDNERRIERVRKAFIRWCYLNNHPLPKGEKQRRANERPLQSIARPESGTRRNSNEYLENKPLVEPTFSATTEEQPGSYHAGGVDVRPVQPLASDRMQH
ncbi:deoxynucleoside triphosphate triphosphohydrolase SAMHD1-like [Mercenaria mercenaria]|uniref:deoxynucleoside triphosphate triphosphohydrolase SAMHD1-like n=1 Tax=Mercenaria mercenaria TaxID=6596 RepID=UPI00234ED6A0|nr:deoxynucleoside triphosphate triphosphohydrolase SAMHD1-like [Mercenaria mercenaria]